MQMRGSANEICVQLLDLREMSISIGPICSSKNKAFAMPQGNSAISFEWNHSFGNRPVLSSYLWNPEMSVFEITYFNTF